MRYEYLSDFELFSFTVLSIGYSGDTDITHAKSSRNQFIIHYVADGCGYFNGNKVSAGEGFIIPPECFAEYHPDDNRPWTFMWIILSPEAYRLTSHIYPCDEKGIFKYGFSRLISSLGEEITKNVPSGYGKTDAWNVYNLIVNEQIRDFAAHTENEKHNVAALAKRYIDVYYYKNIRITEICDVLHCSHTYLYKQFILGYGISPKDYLKEIQIKHAKTLMKNTELNISQIAQSVGFDDPLAFSAFFKRNVGIAPTKFRSENPS